MNRKSTIFTQLTQLFSQSSFRCIVNRYSGDKYSKRLDCWQQLLIHLHSQIMGHDSLREIETDLKARYSDLHHISLQSVARSTFADANSKRPYHIFAEMFYVFLEKCQKLAPKHGFKIKMPVFSLDSTLIPLCLESFPWAKYRKRKGAVKLHMLLDHNGYLPQFMVMSDGKCSDIRAAKNKGFGITDLPPDSILTVDRGYIDYKWLDMLNEKGINFIIRAKSNVCYDYVGQHKECNIKQGVIEDSVVYFSGIYGEDNYPNELRLIKLKDNETGKEIEVLTNNFKLAASTIGRLYKGRWEIETFFRWIKQNLRVKTFIGTSVNAVMTQIWTAMILYLLLSFIKFQTRYKAGLLELLRNVRAVLWEHRSILEVLRVNYEELDKIRKTPQQLAFY